MTGLDSRSPWRSASERRMVETAGTADRALWTGADVCTPGRACSDTTTPGSAVLPPRPAMSDPDAVLPPDPSHDDRGVARPLVARGLLLRSLLVLQLRGAGRPLTVRELCAGLHRQGVATPNRPSKDVPDALRWELRRGRVHRVAPGTYRLGHVARSTAWRMRQRVAAALADRPPRRSEAER